VGSETGEVWVQLGAGTRPHTIVLGQLRHGGALAIHTHTPSLSGTPKLPFSHAPSMGRDDNASTTKDVRRYLSTHSRQGFGRPVSRDLCRACDGVGGGGADKART
jgi:hypothetical protein